MLAGLNIAFAGTPSFAASILESLLQARAYTITTVYTQQDKPVGRGQKIQKTPVKELAEKYNLIVRQPENRHQLELDDELRHVDVLVVAAYGMIIPETVLNRPRFGCINIHTSLLPRWRGAAPIQRAILAGDDKTGVTIMQMDAGLDTGDILLQQPCHISQSDTSADLLEKLSVLGSECIIKTLEQVRQQILVRVKQPDNGITYAHKVQKSEAQLDWNKPATEIDRQIRAFNPAPIAYSTIANHPVRVWQAIVLDKPAQDTLAGNIISYSAAGLDIATADRAIRILKLQLPGKKVTAISDFYNGNPRFWSAK